MNKIIVMGRIANDLELKTTPNGIETLQFRVVSDRNYQKSGEEKKTDFLNVVAWRQTAEFITKWFGKGRMILIEGEMQTRQYTDKNGNAATWYEINVEQAFFTGEKSDKAASNATAQAVQNNQSTTAPEFSEPADDDYPF